MLHKALGVNLLMPRLRWLSPSKQKLLKALFKGSALLPYHAASETAASFHQRNAFCFGSAHSAKPLLSTAVVDCVNAIKQQLGPRHHPHFCQLLVTADAHGSHIEYAPSVMLLHTYQARSISCLLMQCNSLCLCVSMFTCIIGPQPFVV